MGVKQNIFLPQVKSDLLFRAPSQGLLAKGVFPWRWVARPDIYNRHGWLGVKKSTIYLSMSGTLLWGSGGCPPGNIFNLEINLVQSGAKKNKKQKNTFLTRLLDVHLFRWTNEFPWNGTSLFPEISEIPEKWHPCFHYSVHICKYKWCYKFVHDSFGNFRLWLVRQDRRAHFVISAWMTAAGFRNKTHADHSL